MDERRLRDLLESLPFGEILRERLMKTAKLKPAGQMLAEAEVEGKNAQISSLGETVEFLLSKVEEMTRKSEESEAKVKHLTAELEDAKRTGQRQARELGDALERSINLEKTLQNRNGKLIVIGELLMPMTAKTPNIDLWKAVKKAQAAL